MPYDLFTNVMIARKLETQITKRSIITSACAHTNKQTKQNKLKMVNVYVVHNDFMKQLLQVLKGDLHFLAIFIKKKTENSKTFT